MDEELGPKDIYAGLVFHRQIVAFFNAVLVEEMLARRVPVVTLDNPTTSDLPFWSNFRSWQREREGIKSESLFDLMFSCPLFALFLQPTSSISGKNWNLWDVQLKMLVRGRKFARAGRRKERCPASKR
jgi:hypothetical protein